MSVEETKGWVAIYLCMGIINKPNIPSNWNTAPILWCHNVKNKITSESYFWLACMRSEDDSGVVERSVKVNGHWVKQNFTCPCMVSLYNAYMGGVDVSDQRVSLNVRLMRGAVWYFFLSHRSMCFKCTHFGKKISKSYHQNFFRLQKVIDKWLDWRKVLQERHSNVAATHS